jgi:hypothetical protein
MTYNQVGNVIACSGTDLEISMVRITGQGLQRFEKQF